MSGLVTSTAASPQPGLFAPRQQAISVERADNTQSTPAVSTGHAARDALRQPTESALAARRDAAQAADPNGPSRARIEIRSLDFGLTPAEVVGTPDVLQRFDENGDGRVDLVEADKATLSRQKGTTFVGLAGSSPERHEAAAVAQTAAEPKKVFVASNGDGTAGAAAPAKIVGDAAAAGTPSGTVDVPKRFYGQGAEVAVGPTVVNGGQATVNPADTNQAKPQIAVSEDGTGEVKLYDKVAQSERSGSGATGGGESGTAPQEKARVVVAVAGGKKPVLIEVSAYTTTAAITAPAAAEPKVVTA